MSWEDVLAQYFFDQMIMSVGWYSYLPQIYHRSKSNSCINATIAAASSFLAANQLQEPSMLHRAMQQYGIALQAVNVAIAHPERSLEDQTLFSILLLNVLDDLTGQKSCMSGSHLSGCAALLKLREARGFHSEYTPHIAHSIVIQTQQLLMQGQDVGTCIAGEQTFLASLWKQSLTTPAAKLSALSYEVGKIKNAATQLKFADRSISKRDYESRLSTLVGLIDKLDTDLKTWRTCDNPRWTQKSTTFDLQLNESNNTDYYSDFQVSKILNHWRVARILLHSTKLAVIERLLPRNTQLHSDQRNWEFGKDGSMRIINEMLSDIIASIPFHMHEIDGEGRPCSGHSQRVLGGCALIWPLHMVLQCAWASQASKIDAARALRMIGDVLGVKQALVYLRRV
jgi:hypothetical protein